MIIEFYSPHANQPLVTDLEVDESARSAHLFSAEKHLNSALFYPIYHVRI